MAGVMRFGSMPGTGVLSNAEAEALRCAQCKARDVCPNAVRQAVAKIEANELSTVGDDPTITALKQRDRVRQALAGVVRQMVAEDPDRYAPPNPYTLALPRWREQHQ